MGLLQQIKNLQGKQTDAQFAKKLGISESLWKLTRHGIKRVHYSILSGIIRAYPQLIPDVINFMRDDGNEPKTGGGS